MEVAGGDEEEGGIPDARGLLRRKADLLARGEPRGDIDVVRGDVAVVRLGEVVADAALLERAARLLLDVHGGDGGASGGGGMWGRDGAV